MSFCWHKWGKWTTDQEGFYMQEINPLSGERFKTEERYQTGGTFVRQNRQCEKCGKLQLRKERA